MLTKLTNEKEQIKCFTELEYCIFKLPFSLNNGKSYTKIN